VKRLAASVVLAARSNGFSAADQRDAALACVRSYREEMAKYAGWRTLQVWYARVDFESLLASLTDAKAVARANERIAKAKRHVIDHSDFPEMAKGGKGRFVIVDHPPLIYHDPGITEQGTREAFATYRKSLQGDRRALLDRYRLEDYALKVVGIGSVGTYCSVLLMIDNDGDPLFLQAKEARASVLEPYLGTSAYADHGRRIVEGQRLMQSASDAFLGWARGERGRHFYLRQLYDVKVKPQVESYNPKTLFEYAEVCGNAVARAHARSGDAAWIAGYLGKSDTFEDAVARFARSYADQAERDHASFLDAIRKGRIDAQMER
jgi:uncharacterized protein (DUF2252 family)